MTRALEIHVNRSDHHDVETRTKRFAPDGPFEVHIRNHGEGLHVHLSVTGDLSLQSAQLDGNPYLESDETLAVPVDVPTELRPASGTVEVSTGYGRNGVSVDVDVVGESAGADGDRGASDRTAANAGGRSASGAATGAPATTASASGASGTASGAVGSASSAAGSAVAGATAAVGGIASLPTSLAARVSLVARRLSSAVPSLGRSKSGSADSTVDDASDAGGSADAGGLLPSVAFDAGTVLLSALALLAVGAAGVALSLFSGPAVAAGVVAVVLTVLAVGVILLWG